MDDLTSNTVEQENQNEENDIIIIVNMFSGKYPKENLAHEVINLYRTDPTEDHSKGENYVYIPQYGRMNRSDIWSTLAGKGAVKLLMVCNEGQGRYEILGRAWINEQNQVLGRMYGDGALKQEELDDLIDTKIKYGKQSLRKIFEEGNGVFDTKSERITFKPMKCQRPIDPIYINCLPDEEAKYKKINNANELQPNNPEDAFWSDGNEVNIKMFSYSPTNSSETNARSFSIKEFRLFGQKQIRYLHNPKSYKSEDWPDTEYQPLAFDKLNQLFESDDGWEDFPQYEEPESLEEKDEKLGARFLSLINKETSELAYSNMLAFFLNESPELLNDFITYLLNPDKDNVPNATKDVEKSNLSTATTITVERETDNIDLLIDLPDKLIIIENKVTASLNEIDAINPDTKETEAIKHSNTKCRLYSEKGQLQQYVNKRIGKDKKEGNSKPIYVFVICPESHSVYKDYKDYNAEDVDKGKLRVIKIDDTYQPVPVVSYESIRDKVLNNHRKDFEVDSYERRYFDDFIDIISWLEKEGVNDQNQKVYRINQQNFEQAIARLAANNN